jgi:type I restriction enzyme M protein
MAVRKSDLYSSLWASCDELRGGMDASQYKDYVLFMLFIKYVSDKYGDSDEFEPPITIPIGASFRDMTALKGNANIGDLINTQVIQPLVEANETLARTDFPDFNDPNKLGEGNDRVERLSNLISIFESPDLDFSKNRADHDDILGDAYEYLMRHFATESGKSKGQFYTPSEVSRVIAKVIGISPRNSVASTTAYDPTCGSGSLLLKVADEAGKRITLEGQEKDVTTAGLARMNMILHDFPTARIVAGNTLTTPRFLEGERLRTYDYVVANPPFSDKAWSTGFSYDDEGAISDRHKRFEWGAPPKKQGDYAYLLHIIRSMKSTGKAACILPHGVLFRGNAEADLREALVRSGYLKGIIGLPPNLFYGTGIPACIVVLDKENAPARRGIFMIDASKGFRKDGAKNRLREQDIHRIVDTFRRGADVPGYARMVPHDDIADPRNAYNLNLPRYIDTSEAEDIHDIDAHLNGGIPTRDVDALGAWWEVMPGLRGQLFDDLRPGYRSLALPVADVRAAIEEHSEFRGFTASAADTFAAWRGRADAACRAVGPGDHPKELIEGVSEELLDAFRKAPLVDPYDVYQHLMDYWSEALQDDAYLIAAVGWVAGAKPREIVKRKNKDGKLGWPEPGDYQIGRRRFTSDLVPARLMVARFFASEQAALDALDIRIAELEQELAEMVEEGAGEDGLLSEVIEGEGERQKVTARAIKARLREIERDPDTEEERVALQACGKLLERLDTAKTKRKAAEAALYAKAHARYSTLTEDEAKTLVVADKWLDTVEARVSDEVTRVAHALTTRVKGLAERYAIPLPKLEEKVEALSALVAGHLKAMGAELRTGAMQHLLTGQTRLPGFTAPRQVKRLGDHVSFLRNGVQSRAQLTLNDPVRYLHYGDIHVAASMRLDLRNAIMPRVPTAAAARLSRIDDGDVVFVDASEDLVGVGKSVEIVGAKGIEAVAGQHTIAARFDKEVLADGFKGYLQFVPEFRTHLRRLAAGTKVYATNRKHIASAEIALPEPDEQTAIARVLSDMDAEIAALEAWLAKIRALKQAMMQALLTGQVRLPVATGTEPLLEAARA